jgi:hypothetical protein
VKANIHYHLALISTKIGSGVPEKFYHDIRPDEIGDKGLGFGVWGLGFGVWGLGFVGLGFRV